MMLSFTFWLRRSMDLGMGGLGYLEVAEDLGYKGPIDKFIPGEKKKELAAPADLWS